MKKQQKENRYTPVYYKKGQTSNVSDSRMASKKLWTIVVLCLALISAIVASLCVALYEEVIPQNITSTAPTSDSSSLKISNADFKYTYANGENLKYPLVATDWTVKSTSSPNSVSMGVVDTSDWNKVVADLSANNILAENEKSNPEYPNYDNATGFDSQNSRIYMIKKESLVENEAATLISKSISVNSGDYMKISVWVKTYNVKGNGAFIALKNSSSGTASSNYYIIYHITESTATVTNNGWARYDFYVEGNKTSSKTLYLELGLGRKLSTNNVTESASGLIYFGGIEAESISRGTYNAHEQKTLDVSKNYLSYSFYSDELNVTLADWSKKDISNKENKEIDSVIYEKISYRQYEDLVGESNMPFNYDATTSEGDNLFIYTVNNNSTVKFEKFAVNPPAIDKCYRLSMWIRTDVVPTNGAYVYLNAYDKDGNFVKDYTNHFAKIQTSTDIENDTYNGWAEYQFYIQPNETDIYYFELEVSLGVRGNSTSNANDIIYLTEISLYELEQHEYYSVSSSDNVSTVSLKSTITPSDTIANGSFNTTNTSAETTSYPVAPSDWQMIFAGSKNIVEEYSERNLAPNRSSAFWPKTNTDNPEEVYSSIGGIIYQAQDTTIYNTYGILSTDFTGYADDDAHSLLMIYNNQYTACGYKSTAMTLTANSYYRISVVAKGIENAIPYVYLTNGATKVICASNDSTTNEFKSSTYAEIDKNIANGWVRYYFYVATGDSDQTFYLELWNGKRDATSSAGYAQGTVLFDQAECVLLDDTTENSDGVSEEYSNLFVVEEGASQAYAYMQNTNADIEKIYNEQQKVFSNANNLYVVDYRYNDVTVENDFNRIYEDSTKVRNLEKELSASDDKSELNAMMTTLETMVSDFNSKHYSEATEGAYYIDWESNKETISGFRTYLNSIKNSLTEEEDTEEESTTEPVDWIVVSSLIVTVAMLVALVAIIIRKFASNHKKRVEFENNYSAN